MTIRQLPVVTLDGFVVAPTTTWENSKGDNFWPYPAEAFTHYQIQVGKFEVNLYVDLTSSVDLTTDYFEGLDLWFSDEDEAEDNYPNFATVTVTGSDVTNCRFRGIVNVTFTNMMDCTVVDSNITNQLMGFSGAKTHYCYMSILNSIISDSKLSMGGTVMWSRLTNLEMDNSGSGYTIDDCKISDAGIFGDKSTWLENCVLNRVGITHQGYLYMKQQRISDAIFGGPTISLNTIWSFFTIPLPDNRLHVFESMDKGWLVFSEGDSDNNTGNYLYVNEEGFEESLRNFLKYVPEYQNSMVRFVLDSIESRTNIMRSLKVTAEHFSPKVVPTDD